MTEPVELAVGFAALAALMAVGLTVHRVEQIAVSSGTITYLHHDQIGNTRLLTSTTGAVTGTATYDPYGNPTAHTGATTPLGYLGEYGDTETGLTYLRHRYYDRATDNS